MGKAATVRFGVPERTRIVPPLTLQAAFTQSVDVLRAVREVDRDRVAAPVLNDRVSQIAGHPVDVGQRYGDGRKRPPTP